MGQITRFAILLLLVGCARSGPAAVLSPNCSMSLHTRVEQSKEDPRTYHCVVFEIRDVSGRVLYVENTRAAAGMRWT